MILEKEEWITAGYKIIALNGFESIKVKTLAEKMGISKSSFYHHFATLEIFGNAVLRHHLEQLKRIAEKEANCKTIDP